MNNCASSSTPLPAGLTLLAEDCSSTSKEIDEMAKIPYLEALGAIIWLQVTTRLDLSYAVNVLSRFAHSPGKQHWNALKYILLYIKGTSHYCYDLPWTGLLTSEDASCHQWMTVGVCSDISRKV